MKRRDALRRIAGLAVSAPIAGVAAVKANEWRVTAVHHAGKRIDLSPNPVPMRLEEPPPDTRTPEQVVAGHVESTARQTLDWANSKYVGRWAQTLDAPIWYTILDMCNAQKTPYTRGVIMGRQALIINGNVLLREGEAWIQQEDRTIWRRRT